MNRFWPDTPIPIAVDEVRPHRRQMRDTGQTSPKRPFVGLLGGTASIIASSQSGSGEGWQGTAQRRTIAPSTPATPRRPSNMMTHMASIPSVHTASCFSVRPGARSDIETNAHCCDGIITSPASALPDERNADTNGSHPGTGSTNLNLFRPPPQGRSVCCQALYNSDTDRTALVTSAGVSIHASPAPSSV